MHKEEIYFIEFELYTDSQQVIITDYSSMMHVVQCFVRPTRAMRNIRRMRKRKRLYNGVETYRLFVDAIFISIPCFATTILDH